MCNLKSVVYLFTDNRNTKTKIMKTELKKAFDLIKENCSREEQIKELFSNDKGDVVLSNLNFTGLRVFLSGLKADLISNGSQEARSIYNMFQQAEWIYNNDQEANDINNKDQILKS